MDLTIVCGSRPLLLKQTLESFSQCILCSIKVNDVFVNIDLHDGSEEDRQACIKLVFEYFPYAFVNTPKEKSFGSAIKYLWSQPSTDRFLHLEDDWNANRVIPTKRLRYNKESLVRQWFLVKPRVEQSLFSNYRYRPFSKIPFYFPNLSKPAFTTSPSIITTEFALEVSNRLNPRLNPEKQMFNGMNKPLEDFLCNFLSKSLVSWWEKPLITDTGRPWLESRGMQVEIVDGIHGYRNTYPRD